MPITGPLRSVVLMSRNALAAAALRAIAIRDEECSLSPSSPSVAGASVGRLRLGLGVFVVRQFSSAAAGSPRRGRRSIGLVRAEQGPFAVAVGAGGQQRRLGIGHDHADQRSSLPRRMPLTPLVLRPIGRASDSLKRMAMPRAVERTISSPGLAITTTSTNSSSSFELDGDDAARSAAGCIAPAAVFFTRPLARGHDQIMVRQVEIADGPAVGDPLAFGEVEQVDDRPAAAVAAELRQIVDLLPIDFAAGW